MAEWVKTIGIPVDDEGYVGAVCPHCSGDFKVLASDIEQFDGTDLYCPVCGLSHERSLFLQTPDVREVMQAEVQNMVADALNDMLQGLERSTRGSKFVKFTSTPMKKERVPELRAVTDLAEAQLPCCQTTVKVHFDAAASLFYCPFCGHTQR